MRLSYSKLATFLDCGLRFRLQYIEHVPTKPKPHLRFGKILHAALRYFYSYPGPGKPDLEYLLAFYRSCWPRRNEGYRRYYQQGLEVLQRYYYANIAGYHPPYWVEQPFQVLIRRHLLVGRFDRVDHLGADRYEIVDYKAGTQLPTQEQIDEDLQLGIYALAFKKLVGVLPSLSVYHLRSNRKVHTSRSGDEVREVETKIEQAIDEILRAKSFTPTESTACRWCDYGRFCPLKSEDPEPILPKKDLQMELVF